ncbi:hypothetical protein [Dietzia alimentaria]|uniref:hypothetical protein n=1 Tax=Dietzia alimentaria TaxID=665550 RepID=UPI001145AF62|nr:hypothetical protein [Dietzia alimentaria]
MEDDLPLTQEVTKITVTQSWETDRLGNRVPVEVREDAPVLVHSWRIVSSDEPILAGHERTVVDARMIAAVGDFSPTDKVELPGMPVVFEVVGRAVNVDHNPWLHVGREIVNLKEVSG